MRISTIGYVGKQGVKSIWRNKMFSLASIATMSACIFLFGLFFSILVNFQYIIRSAEEGVAITVFFDEEATDFGERAFWLNTPLNTLKNEDYDLRVFINKLTEYSRKHDFCKKLRKTDKPRLEYLKEYPNGF